jgi:hypothetical protein
LTTPNLGAPDEGKKDPAGGKEKKRGPKFTVGKETTYITGPLDKNGYMDYEAALNERLGKGVTPQNNANVLLWKALGPRPEGGNPLPPEYFKLLGIESPPENGAYFVGLFRYAKEHLKLEPGEKTNAILDEQSRAAQRPWAAKDYPRVADWLKMNEKPLALVVEATRRPQYFNPLVTHKTEQGSGGLIGALLPSVQKCRELANALAARAMLHTGAGRYDEAWQDLLACHRLGRLVARGATLIEALVGIAIDQICSNAELAFLERADLTTKQLQERLRDLQQLPPMPLMADKIDLGERFSFLDSVMQVNRHGLRYLEALAGGPVPKKPDPNALRAMNNIDWDPALRTGNRWYDRMVAALRIKDRAAREKELDRIEVDLKTLKKNAADQADVVKALLEGKDPGETIGQKMGDVLIGLLMPATRKVQTAADRSEQVQRNQHLAFALAAYRRDTGRYPQNLDALAPKYLAKVPGDLFSGKAMIYRPDANGYLLYSVGPNGKDDGGRWYDDDPPGDDPRVRMPLPELKRK